MGHHIRSVLFCVLSAILIASALSAYPDNNLPYVINNDSGGIVTEYVDFYTLLALSRRNVVIDGPCLSACTLVFAYVSRDKVCATSKAVLGFHGVSTTTDLNDDTNRVDSREWTEWMFRQYPPDIQNWIKENDALVSWRVMKRITAPEVYKYVQPCEKR